MGEVPSASARALRISLLKAGAATEDLVSDGTDSDILRSARELWAAHAVRFGLVLLGDQDPHTAPGLHVSRRMEPMSPSHVTRLVRSWEAFDRAFEACPMEQEEALFDAQIAPCLAALGLPLEPLDLARDHLFLIDERYVASFPDERWTTHAARHGAANGLSTEQACTVRGLRRVCASLFSVG